MVDYEQGMSTGLELHENLQQPLLSRPIELRGQAVKSLGKIRTGAETVLNRVPVTPLASLDDVLEQDRLARACAMDYATKCND